MNKWMIWGETPFIFGNAHIDLSKMQYKSTARNLTKNPPVTTLVTYRSHVGASEDHLTGEEWNVEMTHFSILY